MTPPTSIMGQIMHVGLSQRPGAAQPHDLGTLAYWTVRPRLMQVPGVAEVLVLGGDRKQYQVLVDPHALREYDVTLPQVVEAVRESNTNATGGFALGGDTERPVRVLGRLDPADVRREVELAPVKPGPKRNVLVGQVAKVAAGAAPRRGDGSIDGVPGVVITVVKQPHTDTRRVT